MNISDAYKRTFSRLRKIADDSHHIDIDTMTLLEYAVDKDKSFILAHPEHEINKRQEKKLENATARRISHEPMSYIIGHAFFYNLELDVTPAVLIPRPATEMLTTTALTLIEKNKKKLIKILDIGTGSGAIIISLAHNTRNIHKKISFTATDISARALSVACNNAKKYKVLSKIRFNKSNLFKTIARSEKFDIIISNLPYVSEKDFLHSPTHKELTFEPKTALVPGKTGLELFEPFLQEAKHHVTKGSTILLEIGYNQGEDIKKMAQAIFPNATITSTNDLCGFNRMITILIGTQL